MFEEIVNVVKQQLGKHAPEVSSIPVDEQQKVHEEVASQITQQLADQSTQHGGIGGLLDQLKNAAASGNPVMNAIEGGVIGSLTSKLGLSPMITGAIAAALPGILQKMAHKAADPNDQSITHEGFGDIFSKISGGGLGSLFNRN